MKPVLQSTTNVVGMSASHPEPELLGGFASSERGPAIPIAMSYFTSGMCRTVASVPISAYK
jgi:hypothetical protein